MKLSYALYNHLSSLKVFETIKQANKNPIILTEAQQNLIENGIAVGKLVKSIYNLKQEISQRTLTPIAQLDQLKQLTTASTKLYNWNIIITAINQLQIPNDINNDIKKLILMGDVQVIEDTLNQLFDFYLKIQQARLSKPKVSPNVRNRILSEQQPATQGYNHLNLSQSQEQIQISDSNTLEYFTQLLSKQLNLQYKQVLSLYAENFKFWAQIVTKGVQRVYEPIISIYKDVFTSVEQLQNLISMEKDKALGFSLNLLKPGLVSKSPEVCIETIKTLGNFVIYAYNNKISYQEDIYQWYVEQCFQTTLLSIKRHPQLVDSLVDLMILFCKYHLVDLFTSILKQHSANNIEMLINVEKLFNSLTPEYILEIQSMGIMQQWLEQGLEILESTNTLKSDEKICILRLIHNIWLKNQYQQHQERVHNAFKAASLDSRECVALFSIQFLFSALEFFGKNKIPEAPIIYKIIAIQLVELTNDNLVHFILQNLLIVFQTLPSIPLSIVLDPFIVNLQEKTYPSLVVFNFFTNVANNPNLTTKSQIQLMDLLSKIAIYDTLHYRIASQIFLQMVTNTQKTPSTQEFVQKFVKISLAVYFSVHKKSDKKKPNQQIVDQQRKAQIIEVLKSLVQIQNENINQVIKMMAGHTNLQFKMLSKQNKGLQVLLSLLGDINEIMQLVELEYQEAQTNRQAYSESSVKEVQQVQGNLKKFSKIKLTKEEQYHLARLRMPKETDPKVMNDISTIKKQFQDKQQEKETSKIVQDEQLKQKKEKLRKQLEKRQIEQGIASLNQKDMVVQLLFPDGSRQTELAKEKKHGLITFDLLDLNLEEEIEKLMVEQILRKYSKVLRYIFTKYANTCIQGMKQPNSFDQYLQRTESINIAEISKFVHDYEIALSIENVQALARQVGTQILHSKTEFKEFDQVGFNQFVFQLAIVLSKNKLADIQPYQCLIKFITHLRNVTASKGQSTGLFDDPESQYFMENDIIKEFNQQLLIDPNYELPQGYKKVTTFEIQIFYEIPLLEDNVKIPYQILNDLLKDALGINIIEPISKKVIVFKAKPDAFGYIQSKLQQEPTDDQFKIKPKKTKEVNTSLQKKKVLEIEPKREWSLNMKLAIAKCNIKDKFIAESVANLLDDMLFAIEHNKQQATRQNQIINRVLEDKKQQQIEQEQQEQKKEQLRKQREKEIKDKLKEEKEKQKLLQESLEKERLEKNKTENNLKKEQQDKRTSYLTEQKQKIKEKNDKEKEEQLRRLLEEKDKKEKEIKMKKHNFQEFNQKQITKLKEIISQGQNKQQQSDKEKQDQMKKQQLLLQQARSKILTQNHSRIQEQKNLEKEIENKFQSVSYQKIIEKYQFGLNSLFQFLIKETFLPIGQPTSREQISFKVFAWFTDRFNLCPEIVSKDDILQLFRYLTRDKEVIDGIPPGMNYDEFLQALHRISIKGSVIFNKVAANVKSQKGKLDIKIIKQIVEAEQIVDQEAQSQSPKAESIVVETPLRNKSKSNYLESSKVLKEYQLFFQQSNENTFESLILYLDVSNDKNQLDQRFRKTLQEKKVPTKLRRKILTEKLGIQN
ncbi:unnamed protein product [Paramecium sonneborni]|uniref:Uncharacterized protein n=1 Tax=Paramecium sonneborni TaxID=65129 RepID=A0A8S1NBH7_9CILI|nr:unnamed protein product [Paramecium sonneborni]